MLTDQDIYLFREGTHGRLYTELGSHPTADGRGVSFAVWAPNASDVSVIGDWNGWNAQSNRLTPRGDHSGIWEGTVPGVQHGQAYKYHITSHANGYRVEKADPFATFCELPPATASRVWKLDYTWHDAGWMSSRAARNGLDAPMSIYELHAGSWRRKDGNFLNYRELAHALADYLNELGFTHVELMPITEHPFYGSWGYQTTGYFAPTARYGTPQDFMYFVDHLHERGIGVILDWVPSHFPADQHGLAYFDGTHLYEHADPRQGFHPEWNSSIFNFGRNEVRSFLVSSALFWFEKYHIDGLRVDAVASMLYLDYARKEGEWIPNRFGGRENLGAIEFLRILNQAVYRDYPDATMIAEESTAWPMVSRPTDMGGLGFGLKWNMGWMHDTLAYMKEDPVYRKYHHGQLTFSLIYAFNENFVLPLSHDEVVYGKGSLIGKMPGDDWQKFANLRTLYGYMWAHPGKKLLFMGGGIRAAPRMDARRRTGVVGVRPAGTRRHQAPHRRFEPRLPPRSRRCIELDFSPAGFEWVDVGNAEMSVIAFLRKSANGGAPLLVVCNFTPGAAHQFSGRRACARAFGAKSSTPMRGITAAPAGATWALSNRCPWARTAASNRSISPCRRLSTLVLRWEGRG